LVRWKYARQTVEAAEPSLQTTGASIPAFPSMQPYLVEPDTSEALMARKVPHVLKQGVSNYRVRGQLEPIDGCLCHVVEWKGKDILWIDTVHGFAVRRRTTYHPSGALNFVRKASGFRQAFG
jgi:hypothetical protein